MRCYLVTDGARLARVRGLVGADTLHQLAESGGKYLFTNGHSAPLVVTSMNGENEPALW